MDWESWQSNLEPLVKGELSRCWELRREEACALGATSLLGGRAEMVKLSPISGWASRCLLATTHYGALESEVSDSTAGLGLLILPQHLRTPREKDWEAFDCRCAEPASGLRQPYGHK